MSHLYQTTKIAEFQQAQMRKDAERERIFRGSIQSRVNRPAALKKLVIVLFALVLLATRNSLVQAEPEQSVLSGWVKVTDLANPGKCIHPDRLRICRGRSSVIQIGTNDPRFAGEAAFVFDSITSNAPYTERAKGNFFLDNGGGSWVGTWKGSTDVQGYTLFTAEGQGSGGYEGLVIRLQMERLNSNRWEPMRVSGTIGKGRIPERRR